MNQVEALKRGVAPIQEELNHSNSYPYTITGYTASALNVLNRDSSNDLTIILTHDNSETTTLTIPASTSWSDQVRFFKIINATTSTNFLIQLKGWDSNDQ